MKSGVILGICRLFLQSGGGAGARVVECALRAQPRAHVNHCDKAVCKLQ